MLKRIIAAIAQSPHKGRETTRIARVVLLGLLLQVQAVIAESGYQVIQGTRVFTEIDHARGVATFSNACGSQTLTQRQLQQGAIPDRIIPCSQGGGSGGLTCKPGFQVTRDGKCIPSGSVYCGGGNYCSSGNICADGGCLKVTSKRVCGDLKRYCDEGFECRSDNKCVSPDAEQANEHYDEGERLYKEERYREAESAYMKAAMHFGWAKQPENLEIAKRNMVRSDCRASAEEHKKSSQYLRTLAASERCASIPSLASVIKTMADIAAIDEESAQDTKKRDAPPPSASPPAASLPSRLPPQAMQTAKGDPGCSDVSGTGGPRIKCSGTTAPRLGLACPGGGDCVATSKWTRDKPYNQSGSPITFIQFRGAAVQIPSGFSLWSVQDEHSPTRRVLVAKPWSGEPLSSTSRCAQEMTTATNRDFEVDLQCETDRQREAQRKFEERENFLPYISAGQCKGTLKMNNGWEKRPLSYWEEHPEEPVGWCFTPERGNRERVEKIRQPDWLPPKECDASPDYDITVNKRGVRGCAAKL